MGKAAETRLTILHKAFELIYEKGYQNTSVDDIIATTKVTKGAFFYHFKSKDEMGLAIINEIMRGTMEEAFIKPIACTKHPLKDIYDLNHDLLLTNPFLKLEYGCPVGNWAQEMTPWNTEFSKALGELIHKWQSTLEHAIEWGKKNGQIRKTVKATQVAYFVMSGYWGVRNFGKVYNSKDCYHSYLKELKIYLQGLK